MARSMRAVVAANFGGPQVMEVQRISVPTPGKGEVLVAIQAAGTNPVDASNRSDGTWAGLSPPIVPGSDASGVIEATGEDVLDLASGDEVFYMSDFMGNPMGTYAEYQVVDAAIVTRKPERLSHVEAAAVPLAAGTAYEVVIRRLDVQKGEWVLLHGAAGGVGAFALQMAIARGARVIASASLPRHSKLMEMGASVCLDYRTQDVPSAARDAAGAELDAVADFVGGDLISRSLAAIRPNGRAASIASVEGDLELLMDRNITLHGVLVRPDRVRLEKLREMLDAGTLHVLIDEVLPLEEAARVHLRLEAGHGQGKVVLRLR
ncbi:MAG: NADPH:quinone reductase [Actinomycetota bacterium]|nr:NADPH:quinone reductase [Actinomycetota bacterium]